MLTLAVQKETTNFSVWWAPSKSHQPQDKRMSRPVARHQVVVAWQKALKSPWHGDWRSSTRPLWTAAETRGVWVWVITQMKTQIIRHFTLTRRLPNQWNYKVTSYSIISVKDEFISIRKVNKKSVMTCWYVDRGRGPLDEVEVNKNTKTRTGQSPAILTEHTWSIKPGFIVWPKQSLFLRAKREISSGKEGPILPARVANQNAAFAHSLARLWNQLLPYFIY